MHTIPRARMRRANLLGRIYLLLFAAIIVACCPVSASSRDRTPPPGLPRCFPSHDIDYRVVSIAFAGKPIRIEQFQPKEAGKHPVIILIHGSGGLLTRSNSAMPEEENFGELHIACAGYVGLLVHYFDVDGILSVADKTYMETQSPRWLDVLERVVDYAVSLPNSDTKRIGLLGESLGGYLALSLAMRDKRIRSVSEYGGGLRIREGDDIRRLPPVLIQHGAADTIVPVGEAYRLDQMLSKQGIFHEVHIYDGLNHYPSLKFREQAEAVSIRFFDETLRRKSGGYHRHR